MLVSYQPSWSRILRQIGRPLAASFAIACAASLAHALRFRFTGMVLPDLPLSVFGAALGLLLGFRTNSAYDRWWEARTLWGGIVNSSRSLARQALVLPTPANPAFSENMVHLQIAFVHALRHHLRASDPWPDLDRIFPVDRLPRNAANVPLAILLRMGEETARLFHAGALGENRLIAMQSTLDDLTNLQGGCERIRNTPLPRQYDYWPEIFVYAYCALLPLAIVDDLGWVTPLVTLFVAFTFLVLNRIGRNLEDPFHSLVYGTPMTSLCRTIENNLNQMIGFSQLPALEPSRGVLE